MIILSREYDFTRFLKKAQSNWTDDLYIEWYDNQFFLKWEYLLYESSRDCGYNNDVWYFVCNIDHVERPQEVAKLIEWCCKYTVDWQILDEEFDKSYLAFIRETFVEISVDEKAQEECYQLFLRLFKL